MDDHPASKAPWRNGKPPRRKERPAQLKALYEAYQQAHPDGPPITNAQLIEAYWQQYEVRLSSTEISAALLKAGIRRKRSTDGEEVAERPARAKELLEEYERTHPEDARPTNEQLAGAYFNKYNVRLSKIQIGEALQKAGIRRGPAAGSAQEKANRSAILKALLEQHPDWTNDKLSDAYFLKCGVRLNSAQVSKALIWTGIVRSPVHQTPEIQQRPARLKAMRESHPEWTYEKLAEAYQQQYGKRMSATLVTLALNKLGIRARRISDAEEIAKRPARLKAMFEKDPDLNNSELAERYHREYGVQISATLVNAALQAVGIRQHRSPDAQDLAERPARLRALLARHPDMTHTQLADEYFRQFGIPLNSAQVHEALRARRGG